MNQIKPQSENKNIKSPPDAETDKGLDTVELPVLKKDEGAEDEKEGEAQEDIAAIFKLIIKRKMLMLIPYLICGAMNLTAFATIYINFWTFLMGQSQNWMPEA